MSSATKIIAKSNLKFEAYCFLKENFFVLQKTPKINQLVDLFPLGARYLGNIFLMSIATISTSLRSGEVLLESRHIPRHLKTVFFVVTLQQASSYSFQGIFLSI